MEGKQRQWRRFETLKPSPNQGCQNRTKSYPLWPTPWLSGRWQGGEEGVCERTAREGAEHNSAAEKAKVTPLEKEMCGYFTNACAELFYRGKGEHFLQQNLD